jgi:hypothetical protein
MRSSQSIVIETDHFSINHGPLAEAAFGNSPASWPLPAATGGRQLWLRAVAAGGQGRYGSAYRDLAELRRSTRGAGRLASLAHSTQASFLRQLGWHTRARRWDGLALALAGDDPEARADALIGLAADALGVGRFALAATLLARWDAEAATGRAAELVASPAGARISVRREWVSAELAMVTGAGAEAVRHAERGVELARTTVGARHRVKSEVVLAAALCCAGRADRAAAVAADALESAAALGLVPLRWALACLLIDIGSVTVEVQQPGKLGQIRDVCAAQIVRGGGIWRTS